MIHSRVIQMTALVLAIGSLACGLDAPEAGADPTQSTDSTTVEQTALHGTPGIGAVDILLVHGAFADGSSWSKVIEDLQEDGYTVTAVQLNEQSLAEDAALVRHAVSTIPRPVVVVGHSYGGAVISAATSGALNVIGLVYVAAFAPDEGESIGQLAATFPPTPAFMHLSIDDQANAVIDPSAFVSFFAPDVSKRTAKALATVQHPVALSLLGTLAPVPGWKTIRTYYQVSTEDQVIDPKLERFFAKRMGAYTIELTSSHVSLLSHPKAISALIERAARAR
jgi:pimeloyl-ACP methyl ester carboxylesterase